jgi:hypothetical protein
MWRGALARDRGGRKYHPDAPQHEMAPEAVHPRLEYAEIMDEFRALPGE